MKSAAQMVSVWFGAIMILVVVAGAIAFSFTDFMDDRLYGTKRIGFVFLLLAYGVYRGFRLNAALKASRTNHEE
jgi:hypothetical protein